MPTLPHRVSLLLSTRIATVVVARIACGVQFFWIGSAVYRRIFAAGVALAGLTFALTPAQGQTTGLHWVGTWTAAPQTEEPVLNYPAPATPIFSGQTLRQIVHTSIGGQQVRVRLSNQFGTAPLVVGAAGVGLHAGTGQLVPGTAKVLTFSGRRAIVIAPGSLVVSDAVQMDVSPLSDLAISLYLPGNTPGTTAHVHGLQTNYVASGDQTMLAALSATATMTMSCFIRNVDVLAPANVGSVVCLGDSITDGVNSTTDTNQSWPNLLAQRLMAKPGGFYQTGVLNQGIAGNRLLHQSVGLDVLSRFDTDVVAQAGVTRVILMEGINDIGFGDADPTQAVSGDDIIAAYRQIIVRAHEAGLKIYGGTLLPFEGTAIFWYYTDAGEQTRQAVNNFIRTSGEFDGVIDFDAALRDPGAPTRLQARFDSGDHLHPNDAGYAAMAAAVKLRVFKNAN